MLYCFIVVDMFENLRKEHDDIRKIQEKIMNVLYTKYPHITHDEIKRMDDTFEPWLISPNYEIETIFRPDKGERYTREMVHFWVNEYPEPTYSCGDRPDLKKHYGDIHSFCGPFKIITSTYIIGQNHINMRKVVQDIFTLNTYSLKLPETITTHPNIETIYNDCGIMTFVFNTVLTKDELNNLKDNPCIRDIRRFTITPKKSLDFTCCRMQEYAKASKFHNHIEYQYHDLYKSCSLKFYRLTKTQEKELFE